MATLDLWPDEIIADTGIEGPTSLLREQAELLGQKTQNLVKAEVQTVPDMAGKGKFIDGFSIISPSLNYEYRLFQVNYPVEFYPAMVVWEGFDSSADCHVGSTPACQVNTRTDLENALHEIFSHPKTIQIVHALMSRSRE